MSMLFRGKAIFKPLNTGRIDERVKCVREWIANIFFYTKNGTTIMIDAGYNYARLQEKMSWLDMDPASIQHILITHQDTDHVGALERDSELLFKDAMVYIGEIENRYLTGEVRRKVFHGAYKLPMVKTDNRRTLLKDGEVFHIGDIKIECILVPGVTWSTSSMMRICLPVIRSGSERTAATASSVRWQRTTSLQYSLSKSWKRFFVQGIRP